MTNTIWTEFKKPSAKLGITVTIFFFIASILYTNFTEKQGAPTYSIQQVIAFDQSKINSDLSDSKKSIFVVNKDGIRIDKNVYVAALKIWNNGDDEIKFDDVRIPFKVEMTGSNNIVSLDKTFETKDNMDGFAITNENVLSWRHFDPKQGLTVNIAYSSNEQSNIKVSGFAVKAKEIRLADNKTLGFFDKRALWPVGKTLLIRLAIDAGGVLNRTLLKKLFKASFIEIILGAIGLCIQFAAYIYIVFLIITISHIDYAPF